MMCLCLLAHASFPVSHEILESAVQNTSKNFHLGGYLIGLLFGITGVLICYMIDKKDMIRSAWYGLGTSVLILLSFLAVFLIGLYSNNDNNRPYY